MVNFQLSSEKVVVVTGGNSGIGRSIVEGFLSNGNRVVVIDIDKSLEEVNKNLYFIRSDLSKPQVCEGIIKIIKERYGQLDILINNAGFQYVSPIDKFPDDISEKMMNLMLRTPYLLSKYSLPIMKENGWGRIINMASIHSLVASPYKSAYITVKHGLIGLTRAVAVESAQFGITCNAIAPTYVRTPLVDNQIKAQANYTHISEDKIISDVLMKDSPVKRLLEPNEVTSMVLYLSSDSAMSINGSVITIDYGYTSR